jgi:hypothetical protein
MITKAQLDRELRDMMRRGRLVPRGEPASFWTAAEERPCRSGETARNQTCSTPRDYAYVYIDRAMHGWESAFGFSRKTLELDREHREGLIAHEVGHVLAAMHWNDRSEDGADEAAAVYLGVPIAYDPAWPGKGLQVAMTDSFARDLYRRLVR